MWNPDPNPNPNRTGSKIWNPNPNPFRPGSKIWNPNPNPNPFIRVLTRTRTRTRIRTRTRTRNPEPVRSTSFYISETVGLIELDLALRLFRKSRATTQHP